MKQHYPRRRRSNDGLAVLGIGLVMAVFALWVGYAVLTKGTATFTVQEKGIKRAQSQDQGGDKYLIYTDKGTFQNTDSLIFLKFRSSDLYGELRVGKTYTCEVNGLRIPLFSTYKNLLECAPA